MYLKLEVVNSHTPLPASFWCCFKRDVEARTGLTLIEGRGQKEKGQRSGVTALKIASQPRAFNELVFDFLISCSWWRTVSCLSYLGDPPPSQSILFFEHREEERILFLNVPFSF